MYSLWFKVNSNHLHLDPLLPTFSHSVAHYTGVVYTCTFFFKVFFLCCLNLCACCKCTDYIDEVFGGGSLWPTDPDQKAKAKLIVNDFGNNVCPFCHIY